MPAFSKAAGCRAEPYGLNRRSRWKKCSERGARCEADSPGSGRGGTALAPSTSKTPGRGGTPRGGHPSPLFGSMGRQGLRPLQPRKVLGFHPKPHKFFEKNLTKNFYLALPSLSAGPLRPGGTLPSGRPSRQARQKLAALSQLRCSKAAFANCPAGSPAGLRNGNEEVGRKLSVYAGLATPPGEGVEASSPSNRLATPSCEEVRKPA